MEQKLYSGPNGCWPKDKNKTMLFYNNNKQNFDKMNAYHYALYIHSHWKSRKRESSLKCW